MAETSKAKLEGNKRHLQKLYRIPVYIPAGQRKPLEAFAAAQGKSLNSYVKGLIEADSGLSMDIKKEPGE